MARIIYFAAVALASVQASEQKCEGVTIKGVIYEKETLKTDLDSPYQFSIDYNTDTIFFSYSTHTKDQRFQLAYLNLKTKEFNTITTITDGFASAVDLENNKLFLGGKGGIYDFNLKSKQTSHLGASSHNIWQMFYKDGLYYTVYPHEEAYTFNDGISKKVTELSGTKVMLIAMDRNNNIYFTNSSGLFNYNKSNKKIINLGEHVINGLNTDINGKLFFSSPNGIYSINENLNIVEHIVTLESVFSVAIAKDGSIIYGTDDSIMRLKKSDKCQL
ncbi:unnamed protein product [Parnassius mnemosyne]|uniref:Ommochrome-binding protein n=1 Tax=Parnassius mnemosyne TaxID=213953 RepID=A0AAV1LWV5_9NEOP